MLRRVKAIVVVMPKRSVLDPQGVAVRDAIRHLGAPDVKEVRMGKLMEIEFETAPGEELLHAICSDLLSNPVIEDYEVTLQP